MADREYVAGFVTFMHYNGRWEATIWSDPPNSMDYWRIRVPVPEELTAPDLEGEVEVTAFEEGGDGRG